jgi:hypothetical protein
MDQFAAQNQLEMKDDLFANDDSRRIFVDSLVDKYGLTFFIKMLIDRRFSEEEFIYAMRTDSFDAYNLRPIVYSYIKENNLKSYYTLSLRGVCRFHNGELLDYQALAQWLLDRQQYNKLRGLNFFNNFRVNKTLIAWRKIIKNFKREHCSYCLEKNILYLDERLQDKLFKFKGDCNYVEGMVFFNTRNRSMKDLPQVSENQQQRYEAFFRMFCQIKERLESYAAEITDKFVINLWEESFEELGITYTKGLRQFLHDDPDFHLDHDTKVCSLNHGIFLKKLLLKKITFVKKGSMRDYCHKILRVPHLLQAFTYQSLMECYKNNVNLLINE